MARALVTSEQEDWIIMLAAQRVRYKDIAARLRMPPGTVGSVIQRLRWDKRLAPRHGLPPRAVVPGWIVSVLDGPAVQVRPL